MATPDFVLELRRQVGTMPLWLSGSTAVIFDGNSVLLVKRADTLQWTPVTGIVDPGEQPADTAVRESLEEAGVAITVSGLASVGVTKTVVYENGDQAQYLDYTFRCHYVSGVPRPADGENVDVRWFPLTALPELSQHMRGRIVSAQSLHLSTQFCGGSDDPRSVAVAEPAPRSAELINSISRFASAAHSVREAVASVPAALWDAPGLGEWSIRELVGHILRAISTLETYSQTTAAQIDVADAADYYARYRTISSPEFDASVALRGRLSVAALGVDAVEAFRHATERALAVLTGAQDRLVDTMFGGMRLSDYVDTRTVELVAHGYDLASAAGIVFNPQESVVERAGEILSAVAVRSGSGDELVGALLGRKPLARDFSVL